MHIMLKTNFNTMSIKAYILFAKYCIKICLYIKSKFTTMFHILKTQTGLKNL